MKLEVAITTFIYLVLLCNNRQSRRVIIPTYQQYIRAGYKHSNVAASQSFSHSVIHSVSQIFGYHCIQHNTANEHHKFFSAVFFSYCVITNIFPSFHHHLPLHYGLISLFISFIPSFSHSFSQPNISTHSIFN